MRRGRLLGGVLLIAVALLLVLIYLGRPQPRGGADPDLAAFLPPQAPVGGERVVVINKEARALGLYLGGRLAAAYPVALGSNPRGHKRREGDGRTPEGRYYVCTRNPRSRFHLFLGLSYPNAEDAQAARAGGVIGQGSYRAITEAIAARRQPPWNTPLGGEVGIHGGGTGADWTYGCIALDNEAIEQLWRVLRLGDAVVILAEWEPNPRRKPPARRRR